MADAAKRQQTSFGNSLLTIILITLMNSKKLKRNKVILHWTLFAVLSFLMCAILIGIDAFFIEPNWIKVRTIRLSENPKLRFVHLTDIHHIKHSSLFPKAVETINRLSPDFVCFTGDLTGSPEENADDFKDALAILTKLKAPVYGVPGNHDYWARIDFNEVSHALKSTGGSWLVDSKTETVDGKVIIFGVAKINEYLPEPEPGKINILLCHYPVIVESLGERKFDLILAGHTHGGQVRIPFFGPIIFPYNTGKYDYGLFNTKNGPLYVSCGLGYFYINVRFNCRPEIILFEL